ncbi:hypothetical protein [Snodgrassella sp. ESL0324]|uniref:hypothetical protein n=1 Tax=Snodgrassella sp. ESL0324 TaxID=2705033 RepID=UPI00158447F6|nr:hypothetical protein [Snodgrassella sp. ESL0324]NUF09818.1 hypothetical protein [Snodgrassella sp. ESL0324]
MLEVTEWSEEQIKYPVGRKGRLTGVVVIFFSEQHGIVIDCGPDYAIEQGKAYFTELSCNNREEWEQVDIKITG